jgi:hypothetical protein
MRWRSVQPCRAQASYLLGTRTKYTCTYFPPARAMSGFMCTTHLGHLEGYMMHSWLLSVRVQHAQRNILQRELHCPEPRTTSWEEWRARLIAQRVAERHITATMSLKVHTHGRQGGVKTSCQDMVWHLTHATAVVLHSVAYYEVATILVHGSTSICSSVSQW